MRYLLLGALSVCGYFLCSIYAIVAISYAASAVFGYDILQYIKMDKVDFVIAGIGLLILTLVPLIVEERFRHANEIKLIKELTREKADVIFSFGTENIMRDALEVALKSDNHIQTVLFGAGKAPYDWLIAVRDHMRERKDKGTPIKYDIIICVTNIDVDKFMRESKKREQIFSDYGLAINVNFLKVDAFLGFDIMIVDSKHICIGLSPEKYDARSLGVVIRNNIDIGSKFSHWFESLQKKVMHSAP